MFGCCDRFFFWRERSANRISNHYWLQKKRNWLFCFVKLPWKAINISLPFSKIVMKWFTQILRNIEKNSKNKCLCIFHTSEVKSIEHKLEGTEKKNNIIIAIINSLFSVIVAVKKRNNFWQINKVIKSRSRLLFEGNCFHFFFSSLAIYFNGCCWCLGCCYL